MSLLNVPEFSVSEFSRNLKRIIEDSFGYVKIKGEISGLKKATSGHLYFSLKDEGALINAICFKNIAQTIGFEIGDGLEVSAFGKITTYEGRSNYQIIIEKIEIAGIGALLEAINKRKQKLLEEGLFDPIYKKSLPFFPRKIAVITSETGAVIQDIINRIQARCPTHILLYPALVQGNQAAKEVIKGIKFLNKLPAAKRPEIIIIARGGGSFEDLLPFSDEELVREVFKSEIPIISAIGHETDNSLIDLVSDLRAPTPTAAAEIATIILAEITQRINFITQKLDNHISKNFERRIFNLENLKKYLIHPKKIIEHADEKFTTILNRLEFAKKNLFNNYFNQLTSLTLNPANLNYKINFYEQKLHYLSKNLISSYEQKIIKLSTSLKNAGKLLENCNYTQILKRGFALIKDQNNHLITKVADLENKKIIAVEMQDGEFNALVFDKKDKNKKLANSDIKDMDLFSDNTKILP
jgi:exodeoxyribonuclease VII large subunit